MIIDIILIILFICVMAYGYKKGAIGIIAKLITVILSFILAYILAETVGGYIAKTDFGMKMQSGISNGIYNKLNETTNMTSYFNVEEMPGKFGENEISLKILDYVFSGVGFVVVFVVSRLVLWIAQKILESIFELPILKSFNKLGGIIASAVLFLLEVSIILGVIKTISSFAFMNGIVEIINNSVITKAVYSHNIIIDLIIAKFIK